MAKGILQLKRVGGGMNKLILAIETSCDETSVAVVRDGEILSNVVFSQLDLHKAYGGVVPSIARVAHENKINEVLKEALEVANVALNQVTHIAVTQGPGLAIALEVGIRKAKELAAEYKLPLLGVNHMAGHLYSALDLKNADWEFPALGLLVSGGHTEILVLEDLYSIRKVGQTLDDACGEAFDKFATMLGLEYPGGPQISKLAGQSRSQLDIRLERDQQTLFVKGYAAGDEDLKYQLPIPMANSGDLNMSYSGLKTAAKQLINELSGVSHKLDIKQTGRAGKLNEEQIGELCVMFEEAALRTLVLKLEAALKQFPAQELLLGGGVAASPRLRDLIAEFATKSQVRFYVAPDRVLLTDNAGMIGLAATVALRQLEEQGKISENIARLYNFNEFEEMDRIPGWDL